MTEADGFAPPGSLLATGLAADLLEERAGWTSQRLAPSMRVYPSDALRDLERRPDLSPMPGRHAALPEGLCFVPRFPLRGGTAYTALLDPEWAGTGAPAAPRLALEVRAPAPPRAEPARVVEIYPTAPVIPANQLKLYVRFSAPMSVGQAARRIRVEDVAAGHALATALLPIDPELWDREHTRLTLLFDPGRIKRGLKPHETESLPLTPGRSVRVVVDAGFLDQDGQPLAAGAERHYRVSEVLRGRPDERAWRLELPRAGTRDPLVIHFDRALDCALAHSCLALRTGTGATVAGAIALGPGESWWSFSPDAPWLPGTHRLCIDPRLEDLAGNSLLRVFDRDLEQASDAPRALSAPTVEIPVRIAG